MLRRRLSLPSIVLLAIATFTLIWGTRASAQQETVLYRFSPKPDANDPLNSLVFDSSGSLYGTTDNGGSSDGGAVYKLTRTAGGTWKEKVIYSFNINGQDGYSPQGNLIFDKAGNLYGTTSAGGPDNYGTVFELTPSTGGGWAEKVIFSFNGINGTSPRSGLIFDKFGDLYGTTAYGGSTSTTCDPFIEGCGTVFELLHKPSGIWLEKVLHVFNRDGTDGTVPVAGLNFDAADNLYGITQLGGSTDGGVVFELTRGAGGLWTENLLHTFAESPTDGFNSLGGLIFDAAGNIYGTTGGGGGGTNRGTVFEMAPAGGGSWTETVLYAFKDNKVDGIIPYGGVIFDKSGNLYGLTEDGGTHGDGTAFELTLAGASWTETLLHTFTGSTDGRFPNGPLILDSVGNLYGTTEEGGTPNCDFGSCGTVFEITP